MFSPTLRTPLLGVLAVLVTLSPASAQSWQQTLTGQTTSEYDQFGSSLACNAELLFIGCPRDDTSGAIRGSGSVTLFSESPSGWSEIDLFLPPTLVLDGAFGSALSLDGERLLIGAPGEDSLAGIATGLVHVAEAAMGTWSLVGSIEVSDLRSGDRFGYAVAQDGEWVAVGAPGTDNNQGWNDGCVFLFRNTPTGWVEEQRLFPDVDSRGARFGHSLAMLGDTLVVGAPEENSPELASGAAYVFTRDVQDRWSTRTELIAEGMGELQRFGSAVALGPATIAIGAPGSYVPFGDVLGPQSSGSPQAPRGLVWVFQDTEDGWSPSQLLRAPGGGDGDLFGQKMHLAEGLLNVSSGGRPTENDREGVTFLYEESGSGWFLTHEIADPSPSSGPLFGAVATHGDGELFVSGVRDTGAGTASGCVQVYYIDSERHQSCLGESCPCENNDPLAGCANSTGSGAELFALGSASITEDDLIIGVQGLPADTPTLVFFSNMTSQTFSWDGILCVGGGTLSRTGRLGRPRLASSTGEVRWGPGILSSPGMASAPERLHLQAIYRDPFSVCGSGVNLSNALEFVLIP